MTVTQFIENKNTQEYEDYKKGIYFARHTKVGYKVDFVPFEAILSSKISFECHEKDIQNPENIWVLNPFVKVDFENFSVLINRPDWWSPFPTNDDILDNSNKAAILAYWEQIGLNNSIWVLEPAIQYTDENELESIHKVTKSISFDVMMGGNFVSSLHCQEYPNPETIYDINPFLYYTDIQKEQYLQSLFGNSISSSEEEESDQ